MQVNNLVQNAHSFYLKVLGVRLHKLRKFVSAQADRVLLPADLNSLLSTTDKYTMVDRQRRKNLWRLAQRLEAQPVAGDMVELGVCNGGTLGVLAAAASRSALGRVTWGYDSFQGLPEPTERDGQAAWKYSHGLHTGRLVSINQCVGSSEIVSELLFEELGLEQAQVRLIKGWFQETLPNAPARPIALLHLDGDWYESVKYSLEQLYDQVVAGGYIVLDDYGYWQGCREALHDFLKERGLESQVKLERCGYTQVYFQKV